MPWGSMPLISEDNKGKILGIKPAKPRVQLFDCALGQPLFWAERKSVGYWQDLFCDLGVAVVVDCTPGSGAAARAALQMHIRLSYCGIARNSLHANFLSNVVDRHALQMMRTAGSPLYHQDMSQCIMEHFATMLAHIEHMEQAQDSAPDGDISIEDIVAVDP